MKLKKYTASQSSQCTGTHSLLHLRRIAKRGDTPKQCIRPMRIFYETGLKKPIAFTHPSQVE